MQALSIPVSRREALKADDRVGYAGRQLPMLFDADVCVVGGGPAGTAAAIGAARGGAATVLVERGVSLGGLAVMGCVYPFMDTLAPDSDTPYVAEVKRRLRAHGVEPYDGVTGQTWHNPELLALIYDEMCEGAGVEVLYGATLVDVVLSDAKLAVCVVQTVAGLAAIRAKTFIDGTGDAFLARAAGVPHERGYEKTGRNQPLSFRFEMGGIDIGRVYRYVAVELEEDWCRSKPPYFEIAEAMHRKQRYKLEAFMAKGVESGELTQEEAEYMQAYTVIGKEGVMSMNCPEIPVRFSATDPLSYSKAVTFGRKMMRHIADYMIRHMPGFEHAYISREAAMLGARESWRIRGKYYLTEADYHGQSRFPDAVCRTAWFIDAHGEQVSDPLPKGAFYEIPYRALVTEPVPNLIVAGRCISASFILQASMRIQPTCMSIGEAAGIAAAWGLAHGTDANEVRWEEIPAHRRSYVTAGA